ncbi:transcriptional regulator [Salmonella enterica subsp. enterica serovar Teddington]|uniref:Rrf2 family transcriptional regulator n=1 Tax=Salmonella enterica subsp. enterica serovar Abeokuta TaxID=2926665 RepID=A0A8T9IEQ9_SALET|nr:Rrf2 family transcriptional regulator [Salmonella enterica]EBV1888615.1 transcriptional regulator [Salmonella enterica subsp. enterica serovar Coquilhatville]EBW5579091.1 transcriptional regulator [Salmonella enterica subsp. enterica serovar Teddington]ECE5860661.1 transcriptional regulator [Salmonella enterica subsp. enterica]SQJ25085.1 Iron-sulfur cluster regulator IscR [Salmonella enterica subsp. enterica] [Salmonella enterica subsp. enterica serovar Menston]EBA4600808.1 transcriptional 
MEYGIKRALASVKAASAMSQMYDGTTPITIKEISDKCGLSTSYLEQIFVNFRAAKFVHSVRGPGGGYHVLNTNLTVADVIRVTAVAKKIEFYEPMLSALEGVRVASMGNPGMTK